jgi:hypothetical protein
MAHDLMVHIVLWDRFEDSGSAKLNSALGAARRWPWAECCRYLRAKSAAVFVAVKFMRTSGHACVGGSLPLRRLPQLLEERNPIDR